MTINDRTIAARYNLDTEAEFANRRTHPLDVVVVAPRIARIFDRPIDRPMFEGEIVHSVVGGLDGNRHARHRRIAGACEDPRSSVGGG
jgi:hypothetical protein